MKLARLVIGAIVVVLSILPTRPSYANDPTETPSPGTNVFPVKKEIVEPTLAMTERTTNTSQVVSLEEVQQLERLRRNHRSRVPRLSEGDPGAKNTRWDMLPPETRPLTQSGIKNRIPTNPGDFIVFQNSSIQSVVPTTNRDIVTEPTVANRRSVVFQTGNIHAALSTNNGATFRFIDPSGAFPQPTGGACCDQVVLYDSSRDLMLWSILYFDNGTQNVLRLGVSRGDDIVNGRWSYYYDWWSPTGTFYDFPDMCLSNNRLWLTVNTASLNTNTTNNSYMRSISLDELKAGNTLNTYVVDSASNSWNNYFFRCTRGATNTMYWGSHNNTSQLRVFKWVEGTTTVSYINVNLSPAWNNLHRSCPGPDGRDWCGWADEIILGAWVAKGSIGFMWSASQGGSFPFPYVEVVRLNESDLTFRDRPIIWSTVAAWIYPSASPNARGDLGVNMFYGGGSDYPTAVVGIDDDFNGDPLTAGWELVSTNSSTHDPLSNEWGDYVSILPFDPGRLVWIAGTYVLQGCGGRGCIDPRYVVFGRERDRESTMCYLASSNCVFLPLILR